MRHYRVPCLSSNRSMICYFFSFFFFCVGQPPPSLATGVRGTVKGLCDRDPVPESPNRAVVASGTGWRRGHEGRERGLLKIGFDYTITRISAAVARVCDRGTEVFTSGVISGFFFARANFLTRRSSRGLISEKKVISWKRKSDILHPEEKHTTPKEVEREIFRNREREKDKCIKCRVRIICFKQHGDQGKTLERKKTSGFFYTPKYKWKNFNSW